MAKAYGTDIRYGYACVDRCLAILDQWEEGIDSKELLQRVLENSLDRELTAKTQHHIVRELFKHRFMTPEGLPWTRVLKFCGESYTYDQKIQISYLLMARADPMIFDFVTMVYWPNIRKGHVALPPSDAVAFIENAADEGRGGSVWSDSRKLRLSRGLHKSLCEFGLIRKSGNLSYQISPPVLNSAVGLLLAYELHERGFSDEGVISHPDWALFGMNRFDVLNYLRGSQFTDFIFLQSTADLVEISWRASSMKEVAESYV